MRQARIFYKKSEAGVLIQNDDGSFTFIYNDLWFADKNKPSISLTLPKTKKEYHSNSLFSFFFNILPEGVNKQAICKKYKIDAEDYFSLLVNIAKNDTIGAVKVLNNIV
jgi:HipA-like protein